jgi:4-amino-4-deoxy-L-arabinose transferase-like glycosyltransferase
MKIFQSAGGYILARGLWLGKRYGTAATILGGSALIASLAVNEIRFNTPSFDGAMNLQVSRSLLTTGKYATTYDEVREFDPRIQTGPPLLFPIALAFRTLGVSNWTAQLPNVIYLVGSCVLLMLYASRFGGIFAAVTVLLLILATKDVFDLGLRAYGEVPALFFFVAGLLLFGAWEERPREGTRTALLVGACLGLAVLTKMVMLITFPAVILTLIAGPLVHLRRPRWREGAAFATGALGIVSSFELFKLSHLGTRAYIEWWQTTLTGIGKQAGMTDQGQPAAGYLANVALRFSELSQVLDVPRVWLGMFLVGPYLLILLLAATGRLRSASWRGSGSLLLLASMSGGYLLWWLVFTPLDRIWLRRVLDGVFLHELLSAIALSGAVMLLQGRGGDERGIESGRAARAGAGALAVALLLGVGAVLWCNLGELEVRRGPSDERVAAERLAERIRHLPKNAVVYGKGWWQAPVVSFFAGRDFKDLDWMARDLFEADLEQRYFVADRYLEELARDELDSILAGMDYEVIESVFDHSLVRVRRVYPYVPFVQGEGGSDARRLVNVAKDDYPHVRGLHDALEGGRWARRFAGVLLSRDGEECLQLRLWFPEISGYRGGRVRLAVEVDDMLVRELAISSGGNWEAVLPVARSGSGLRSVSEVEVGIDNWWQGSGGNFAQLGFLMQEVGFVDCGTPQRWRGGGRQRAEPLVVLDYGPRSAIVSRGFNVQPDGKSAMWFRVKGGGEPVAVVFGGERLRGFWDGERDLVTVALSEDELAKEGTREIRLCDPVRDVCSAPVYFPVLPPGKR